MTGDASDYDVPTRRDYLKYGGTVVGGGLRAGDRDRRECRADRARVRR